jgi:hypothetical protein
MTTVTQQYSLAVTEEERTHLLEILGAVLRDTHVEVHRTESPDYRVWVKRREEILGDVVRRLQGLGPQCVAGHSESP